MSDFDEGFLVGLLVGEGHFGGDGRQPQITLRMHVRHDSLFRWLVRTFPGGRLYGPYDHGGRRYYQWMLRGPYLRDVVLPLLERRLSPALDAYAHERLAALRADYARQLRRDPSEPLTDLGVSTTPAPDAVHKNARAAIAVTRRGGPTEPRPGEERTGQPDPPNPDVTSPHLPRHDQAAAIFSALRGEMPAE